MENRENFTNCHWELPMQSVRDFVIKQMVQ